MDTPEHTTPADVPSFRRRVLTVWVWLLVGTMAVAVFFAAALEFQTTPGAWLGISLDPKPALLRDVADIWLRNLVVLSPALAGPAIVRWLGRGRLLLLLLVWSKAIIGAATVGLVAGAYGLPSVPWLVHVPVEWAAVAIAIIRLSRLGAPAISGPAMVVLLAVAALLEVYAAPHA